jgi:hypothetical protein
MKKMILAFCLFPMAFALAQPAVNSEETILKQIQLINQIPEAELSEKTDPGFSLLKAIYDQDGPDFFTLRKLLGQAAVRSTLNPSSRCLLAGVISQRWDTFTLSGNLYLSGLKSANPDFRDKARKKLIGFIQPAHIPALIELLQTPGPNVLAYEILQEATGQRMDPSVKSWRTWWAHGGSKTDIIGHLLNDTRTQLSGHMVHPFDQERFWYLPEGVKDAQTPYAQRPEQEQKKISDWNTWVNTDVKRYVDDWSEAKPILDRIIHQPDPRVNKFLETLVGDPGSGDYASVVLAWRSSKNSLDSIRAAYETAPTVGRALARGSLGDKTALDDLLGILDRHQAQPMSYKIMDDDARLMLSALRTVGAVSAEQAFELLSHNNFEFQSAATIKEKKKAFKKAKAWLKSNAAKLTLDRRRGYYTVSSPEK